MTTISHYCLFIKLMSKLDLLLSFVDDLDRKSNHIISSFDASNSLINDISNLHTNISTADLTIDSISNLYNDNLNYLREFDNLYEKCFYLEANLHLNDDVTNQTSFEKLHNDFNYLLKIFKDKNNSCSWLNHQDFDIEEKEPEEEVSKDYSCDLDPIDNTPLIPGLHKTISISNLKLKPIRCKSSKISKKKSRYRLSSAYTLNPLMSGFSTPQVASSNSFLSNNDDDLSTVIIRRNRADIAANPSSTITPSTGSTCHNHPRNDLPQQSDSRYLLLNALTDNSTASYMDTSIDRTTNTTFDQHTFGYDKINHQNDSNTISSSPSFSNRARSNSLPDLSSWQNLGKSNEDRSHELSSLRHHRLNHFISYNDGFKNFNKSSFTSMSEDDELDHHSQTFSSNQVNIDDDAFENISVYSDISYDDSPFNDSKSCHNEDFDNFENFLRKSRIDLNNAFPNIQTHDNHFDKKNYSFHNPISNIHFNQNPDLGKPTIESIYSHPKEQTNTLLPGALGISSTKLLNEVISKNSQSGTPAKDQSLASPTPKGKSKNFALFNLLTSPSKKTSLGSRDIPQEERRNSIDVISKSLTETFKSLVNNNPSFIQVGPNGSRSGYISPCSNNLSLSSSAPTFSSLEGSPRQKAKISPPKKIKRMHNKDKRDPISIKNDIQNQRLPPTISRLYNNLHKNSKLLTPLQFPHEKKRVKNGYHSQLTIGPSKTKIIDHGESSIFRKPLVSKISHDSLKQALAETIIENND